ncbi:MAG: tetratricopeptide repeat protein [Magnetococcales bacterium]|nr:tetratricopeptide repeat protein [Magnetococcales bacterium]
MGEKTDINAAYKQALDHFIAGRYSNADQLCTAIIQALPSHLDAINLLGVIAQKANRHDKAIELFFRAIDIDNSRALLYQNLGISLYHLGRKDEAIQALQMALKKEPENREISVILNNLLSKDVSRSQQNGEEALQQGIIFHQSARIDEAIQCYKKCLEFQPENIFALSNLGAALQANGSLDASVAICQKAIALKPDHAYAHYNLGNALQDLDRGEEAIKSYQNALLIKPDYAEAHNNIGNVLKDQGNFDAAVRCYQKAVAINPNIADFFYNLGYVMQSVGKLDEAIISYQKAISLKPDYADVHYNLGVINQEQGKIDEAVICYKNAIAIKTDYFKAYCNLGIIAKEQGKLDEAVIYLQKSIFIKPDNAVALYNLGNVFKEQKKLENAIECYKKAVGFKADFANAYYNLGNSLKEQSMLEESIAAYAKAINIRPNYLEAHINLGIAVQEQGDLDAAITIYQEAVSINPDSADAYSNIGNCLQKQGKLEDAINSYQKALAIKPDDADIHSNFGIVLLDQGKFDKAVASFKTAISINPDFLKAQSNLLLCSQYIPGQTLENLFLLHKNWGNNFSYSSEHKQFIHHNNMSYDRRLRIGFVSADLGRHPIGYFMIGFLKNYNRSDLETICYSDRTPDDLTKKLEAASDLWVKTSSLDDDQLAKRIYSDRIDILIDLSGHTAKNRLAVFAKKPAPIQMSWAGYVGTTGLEEIDWLIADHHYVLKDEDKFFTERIIRLPDSWACYTPPEYSPEVVPRPKDGDGRFILGNFGNPSKINDQMLNVWLKILLLSPKSDIQFIYKGMDDGANYNRIINFFRNDGVEPDRIKIIGGLPHKELLSRYNSIDLALDTLPYSGGLTTMEALWMGVPVVTTSGETFAGRHTTSILRSVGLNNFVTNNLDEYVQLVVDLISNPEQLHKIKNGLQNRVLNSPLCDCKKFSIDLTMSFRNIWKEWCSNQQPTN